MKKFLICVLALCLAFSIVSCQSEESVTETTGTTEIAPEESGTEETTVNKNDQNKNQLDCADFINYRASLANTYKKLTEDKKLNVVYFGGSVTAGHGATVPDSYSWRALIGKWLKTEFPDAQINNINRALGESGTYLGAHRVQMDVISAQPDLLFIEYSINDYYYKSTYEQAASQYETIIREVKTALPDTDIVTVLVTEKNFLMTNVNGKLHTQAQAHEDIAKAYNIPTIHAGRYLAATSKFIWSKYAIDGVHLNDTGYAVYYEVIREFMHTNLLETDYTKPQEKFIMADMVSDTLFDGNRTYTLPSQSLLEQSGTLGGTGVTVSANDSSFGNGLISTAKGQFIFDSTNDVLAIKFNGTEIAAYVLQKKVSWMVSVDGGEYTEVAGSNHNPVIFAQGLDSGEHTLKIKLKAESTVKVGAIFTRDATLATKKAAN